MINNNFNIIIIYLHILFFIYDITKLDFIETGNVGRDFATLFAETVELVCILRVRQGKYLILFILHIEEHTLYG